VEEKINKEIVVPIADKKLSMLVWSYPEFDKKYFKTRDPLNSLGLVSFFYLQFFKIKLF
jgi:hypothetical protein